MGKKNKEQSVDRVTKYFKDGIVDYHSISCHVSLSETTYSCISLYFSTGKKKLEEVCSRWPRKSSFSPSAYTTNDSSF